MVARGLAKGAPFRSIALTGGALCPQHLVFQSCLSDHVVGRCIRSSFRTAQSRWHPAFKTNPLQRPSCKPGTPLFTKRASLIFGRWETPGGFKWRTQKEALDEGVDMVVATPGRLAEHIKAGNLRLEQCRAVVLDEVDVLLGDTFAFAQQVRLNPSLSEYQVLLILLHSGHR